jgi:hypothetical protein
MDVQLFQSLSCGKVCSLHISRAHYDFKRGRPTNFTICLFLLLLLGPDYTPWELEVYSEDGILRPVNALIATPKRENAIAIRNIAQMEFPFNACINIDNSIGDARKELMEAGNANLIQGGALRSYTLPEHVESVQVLLRTDGRHLVAKVELLQGPNNKKQVFDVYASDGSYRPLHIVIDTPGGGNVLRIINKYTMEYPLLATVEPLVVNNQKDMGAAGLTLL